MITVITGNVGGGKTHYAVNNIVAREWRRGRNVYSNTLLFFRTRKLRENTNIIDHPWAFVWHEKMRWRLKQRLWPHADKLFNLTAAVYDPQDFDFWRRNKKLIQVWWRDILTVPYKRGRIIYFSDVSEIVNAERGIILIDEGSALFDARNWESLPDNFANSLRQSRKNGLDLVTTTQDMGQIDINYRRLVMFWLDCRMTWLHIWSNPVVIGLFAGDVKNPSHYVIGMADAEIPVEKTIHYWITIFRRRRYDTNYNVGFSSYKIVRIDKLKHTGDLKTIWAIVPKKRTYKEIIMAIKSYHAEETRQRRRI